MKWSFQKICCLLIMSAMLLVTVTPLLNAGTTGKIAGQVVDKKTGTPLPGATVVVVGTSLGAAADGGGNYYILNVPPGTYSVRASVVGYAPVVQSNVRVNIDLTSTVDFKGNFALQEEAIQAGEITIVAERPVVQPDVSANIASVSSTEIVNLPRTSVQEVIDLQAGIEKGLVIRGGGLDQINFALDGITMRDSRDNEAFTSVSYTAIDEFQVQTGGFNAEYGDVRSGLINVVTKEGRKDRYTFDGLVRYKPAQKMNFGGGPKSADAYWWRPYTDPAVSDVGTTNGPWDQYTRRQYPSFDGWNLVSQNTLSDTDPTNDLTVAQLKEIFAYHHRKSTDIEDANYELDATFGGPFPFLSQKLGDLRFVGSYRGTQTPYFYPQARTSYSDDLVQGKITSNIKSNMKFNAQGLWAKQSGMAFEAFTTVEDPNPDRGGLPLYPWADVVNSSSGEPSMINFNGDHVGRSMVFGTDARSISDVERLLLGASFVHTTSPSTFYEVQVSRYKTDYSSHPNRRRDFKTIVKTVGQTQLDEAPYGWTSDGISSPGSGLRLGGHWARARDTSRIATTTARFDITSQLNRVQQLKAGVEMNFDDYDMTYGSDDSVIVHLERSRQKWNRSPIQGAAYVQSKLEFKGMIANVGLRMDYFDPRGAWYTYDTYDRLWTAKNKVTREDLLETQSTDKQLAFSPRLGVSFPISVGSKLYFNYGHFRQLLSARELFQLQVGWLGDLRNIGNPNQPYQRTVAYELGYEQNVFDQYLLRLSAYYRDNDNQPRYVQYNSIDGLVHYNVSQPLNYHDVRGFEITLNKARGRWIRGFANFTFSQFKSGDFGLGQENENQVAQRDYLLTSTDHYQFRPVSQPFGTLNLEFVTPSKFGPEVAGGHPLSDFRLDLLTNWRAGQHFTWNGGGGAIAGLQNNVQMKDFWSFDLRLSKNVQTSLGSAQFFMDINNILSLKYMYFMPDNAYGGPFEGAQDWEDYMKSLHLNGDAFPADVVGAGGGPYINIPGSDRPGDSRKEGAAFVPIERVANASNLPSTLPTLESNRRLLYYVKDTGQYMEFRSGAWGKADQGFVDQVLKDKAYIDMPNELDRTFLNPRSVMFGMRFSF